MVCKAAVQMLLKRVAIHRQDFIEEPGDRLSQVTIPDAKDFVKPRRQICPICSDIPIPQTTTSAPRAANA